MAVILGAKLVKKAPALTRVMLKACCRNSSSSAASSHVRNVGIMAHIDAGKTTTTERMLYYSGFVQSVGEVHRGDTVMDYMEQERDRGITITSAAITFPWKGRQVNLIDTPGHVDFTMEVERSLRVLDGGIVVLDASAGVEAQTLTVWRQADAYRVPRIAFLNKMDKPAASLQGSLDSLREKVHAEPLLIQLPLWTGKHFKGVVDLLDLTAWSWDERSAEETWGKEYSVGPVEGAVKDEALEARIQLIDALCERDEPLSEVLLERESYDSIAAAELRSALRRVTLSAGGAGGGAGGGGIVTLCGSAYKNVGVQPLMDAVVEYLPSPADLSYPFLAHHPAGCFCGLAFKTVHHPQRGALTFVRVYGGAVKEGDTVYNMSRDIPEKVTRLTVAFADDFKNVREVGEGNIAVLSGLKDTFTGDTLVTSSAVAKDVTKKWLAAKEKLGSGSDAQSPYLSGMSVPSPVFYCSVEPPSLMYQKQLELALRNLSKEDPSLGVSSDKDTGQTVLSGMGELHLEVVLDRIRGEYKVDAELGPFLIAYREAPVEAARRKVPFKRQMLGQKHEVVITLSVEPAEGVNRPQLHIDKKSERLKEVPWWQLKEMRRGLENAVTTGPLLGYPVINCRFMLHDFESSQGTPPSLLSSAASVATAEVLRAAGARLLEPVMQLEVATDEEMAKVVTQDLIRRRGAVLSTEDRGGLKVVTAEAPLAELRGYSRHVRTVTSGRAFFGMELDRYELMEEREQNKAIEEVTGFAP